VKEITKIWEELYQRYLEQYSVKKDLTFEATKTNTLKPNNT